jgi:hypothetical protein
MWLRRVAFPMPVIFAGYGRSNMEFLLEGHDVEVIQMNPVPRDRYS